MACRDRKEIKTPYYCVPSTVVEALPKLTLKFTTTLF